MVGVERDDFGLGRSLGDWLGEGDGDGIAGAGEGAGAWFVVVVGRELAGGLEALDGFVADEVVDGEEVFFLLGGARLSEAVEVFEGARFALASRAAFAGFAWAGGGVGPVSAAG